MVLLLGSETGELDAESEELVVEESRPFKRGELVKFEGIADRTAAETLTGRYLLAPRTALPEPEPGEFYYHQLLGLAVETVSGKPVGRVREVFETEPHHLLEVKSADGKLHLIPFAERIVKEIDLEGGRLVIEPPPGLLEL
jgi:16S rRNA processing protein RimM